MNILVYDIAAENSGAVTILNDFYDNVKRNEDEKIRWIFLLSIIDLEETGNIQVLKFPWIKKSWFHRLFFDYFIAPIIVKKYNIDKIFSLQNTLVPLVKEKQLLYLHQSLPFVKYKFKVTENFRFWMYQNVVSKFIFKSIVSSEATVVQTKWMKEACLDNLQIDEGKIVVVPPYIEIKNELKFKQNFGNKKIFFYPATANSYKNHIAIIEACKELNKRGIFDYKVLLTISGLENKYAAQLRKNIENSNVNIELIGFITREEVLKLYSETILLFPSYVESHPMPLKEAQVSGSIILASNCSFSTEILGDYPNSVFFDPFAHQELFEAMKIIIEDRFEYVEANYKNTNHVNTRNTWDEIIGIIDKL